MRNKIKEQLIAATDEIFLEWQAKLHIIEGANNPFTVCAFDDMLDKLADQIVIMLNEQPKIGIVKLTMLDGTEVDLSKMELGCAETKKLAEIEEYLREKGADA